MLLSHRILSHEIPNHMIPIFLELRRIRADEIYLEMLHTIPIFLVLRRNYLEVLPKNSLLIIFHCDTKISKPLWYSEILYMRQIINIVFTENW